MLKKYTDDGYYGTEIKTLRTLTEEGNLILTFAINEETHCKLHKVYFKNNTVFTESELREAIVTQRQWWRYIFRMGNFFNPDLLPLDKDKLRRLYATRGYMDCEVTEIIQEKIEDGAWIDITFVLNEGQPYKIGNITMTGNTAFTEKELLGKTKARTGDIHSTITEDEDLSVIKAPYEKKGYIDLKVYPHYSKNSEKHVVDVEYRVSEGRPVHIRNISIMGNTITDDEVIRRELNIAPGDLGDNSKIRSSRARIQNLGYFSSVEMLPVETDQPDLKDLRIELKERPTGQLSVGAGFSSEDNAIAFIEFTESNFSLYRLLTGQWPPKGAGERLRARLQVGSNVTNLVISHTEPWFLDHRLELNTDLFIRKRYEDEYYQRNLGIGQMLSWPVAFMIPGTEHIESWRIGIGYRVEQIKIGDVTTRSPLAAKFSKGYVKDLILADEEGIDTVPRLIFRMTRDTRDAFMFPTRGSRVLFQSELLTKAIGSYETYGRFTLEGSKYYPISKALTLKLRADYATNTNEKAGIFDRFFGGGVGSVRGFNRGDVAPFDVFDDSIGGNSMLTGSVELLTPIKDIMYFSVFADAGNSWWKSFDMRLDDLCYSVGFGFQLKMLPISIFYGHPIQTSEDFIGKKSGRIHFNMGFTF